MDVGRIFARSLELTWRYRFLWLLGLVMGLTGSGFSGNGAPNFNFRNNEFRGTPFGDGVPRLDGSVVALLLAVACLFFLLWLVLTFYFRFVARGALVSAVRNIEEGGTATLRSSWSEGQKYYGRLLGLGLIVNVPLAVISSLLVLMALSPVLLALIAVAGSGSREGVGPAIAGSALLTICAVCCVGIVLLLAHLVIHPLYEFAVRAIVLENKQTTEGIRVGIQRVRENVGSLIGVYLLLIGARIGWAVVTAIVAIPIVIAVIAAALAAVNIGWGAVLLLALGIGIPAYLLFGFMEGLFQVLESNVWTEAYLNLPPKQTQATPAPVPQ